MRAIALEEHFATPAFLDGPHRHFKERAERAGGRLAARSLSSPMSATAESRLWMRPASTCRRCR
jgi:hypothetical protein